MFAKASRASDSAAAFLICQRVQLHHILFKRKEKEKLNLLYMKDHILIFKKIQSANVILGFTEVLLLIHCKETVGGHV